MKRAFLTKMASMAKRLAGLRRLFPFSHESVYFFTLHKCASSLFSDYVLKQIDGLRHVDYDSRIYNGTMGLERPVFEKKGHVYGPIRIYAHPARLPVYRMLVEPTTKPEFVRDKIAIFFVRDPRDILVSAYYSFGYSHGFSPVGKICRQQKAARRKIQGMSLDEYALEFASEESKKFEILRKLAGSCERGVVLRYEDMIENFEPFIARLCRHISISEDVAGSIYEKSRPKVAEDASSHRRSGRVGGFRDKLCDKTLEALDKKLKTVLEQFGYG